MLEIAFGKATITRNAQRVGFGKPAVSPQCSECYRCPTTSRFLHMFTSFSHTTPRAPFTTKLFRNSAHGSGSMPPTLLYGNFWSDCETRSANRHFTTIQAQKAREHDNGQRNQQSPVSHPSPELSTLINKRANQERRSLFVLLARSRAMHAPSLAQSSRLPRRACRPIVTNLGTAPMHGAAQDGTFNMATGWRSIYPAITSFRRA